MLELKDNALQRILPSSISGDATVKDIVQAISGRLAQLGEQAELVLILPRLLLEKTVRKVLASVAFSRFPILSIRTRSVVQR